MKEFLSISSTLQTCNKNEMIPLHKHLQREFLSVEQIISRTDFWLFPYLLNFKLLTENDVKRERIKVRRKKYCFH